MCLGLDSQRPSPCPPPASLPQGPLSSASWNFQELTRISPSFLLVWGGTSYFISTHGSHCKELDTSVPFYLTETMQISLTLFPLCCGFPGCAENLARGACLMFGSWLWRLCGVGIGGRVGGLGVSGLSRQPWFQTALAGSVVGPALSFFPPAPHYKILN